MKAFKKWKEENYLYVSEECSDAMESAWRAFGEWLLTQSLCGYSSDIVRKELDQ